MKCTLMKGRTEGKRLLKKLISLSFANYFNLFSVFLIAFFEFLNRELEPQLAGNQLLSQHSHRPKCICTHMRHCNRSLHQRVSSMSVWLSAFPLSCLKFQIFYSFCFVLITRILNFFFMSLLANFKAIKKL